MRRLAVTAGLLLIAAPAWSQIVRVSVSTNGTEANGPSQSPSISGDGRFVVFASEASNLVIADTNNVADVFLRDRDTDADGILDEPGAVATTRLSVAAGGIEANGGSGSPEITPDGRYVAFTSLATNLVPGVTNAFGQVYRLDRQTSTLLLISRNAGGVAGDDASSWPVISADGDIIAFHSRALTLTNDLPGSPIRNRIFAVQVSTGQITRLPVISDGFAGGAWDVSLPSMSDDGSRIAFLELKRVGQTKIDAVHALVVERASNAVTDVPVSSFTNYFVLSPTGATVFLGGDGPIRRDLATGNETKPSTTTLTYGVYAASPSGRFAVGPGLVDFELGLVTSLGFIVSYTLDSPFKSADFSADGRWLTVASRDAVPGAGTDTNTADDIFVIDLPLWLDADTDGMDDRWETVFGVTDPTADPDGDGQTNAQEEDAGTHPNGQVRRFLAEGATGTFFDTTIALANPSLTQAVSAVLTFDSGIGTRARRPLAIPAGGSAVVDVGGVAGFWAADVSTTVESDRLLGVQRSMTWGSGAPPYGSSAETATPAPSQTWFLAEGTTVVGFDLFYLLQNPQPTTAHATVRFLLPSGATTTRTYDLAPGIRTTIYVNNVAGLEETDVSGDISADVPIVVERAMYRSSATEPFGLGTESMGVTAAATSWFLAEGATGTFFDLYVLIANPGNADATVRADYARPDGSVVTQTYTVRAHSRHTVYVDSIQGLEATPVATTLTSTNGVPIVAERAMYWPGGFFDYYEGHSSAGSTTTALSWVVAGGSSDYGVQTFVLIANTENRAGEATITLLPDVASFASAPPPTVLALPASSRTTVEMPRWFERYGVLVQSTGASPVQLVVESAVYRTAGALWSAGENALATPVP